ncbi:hypothetical protein EJB05_42607, partial [Eragrostis curvula]
MGPARRRPSPGFCRRSAAPASLHPYRHPALCFRPTHHLAILKSACLKAHDALPASSLDAVLLPCGHESTASHCQQDQMTYSYEVVRYLHLYGELTNEFRAQVIYKIHRGVAKFQAASIEVNIRRLACLGSGLKT